MDNKEKYIINIKDINVDDKYIGMQNIEIDKISCFFTSGILKKLTKLKITNLGQFLTISDLPDLVKYIGPYIYSEFIGTSKILKCKYLGINPMIDENDTKELNDGQYLHYGMDKYVQEVLGLSSRGANAICYNYSTLKDFFSSVRNNNAQHFINSLGKCTQTELVAKVQVIIDYHDRLKICNHSNNLITLGELAELQEKLNILIIQKNTIDKKLEEYIQLVEEKKVIEKQIEEICLFIGTKFEMVDVTQNIEKKRGKNEKC